jgi:hypothetical protein
MMIKGFVLGAAVTLVLVVAVVYLYFVAGIAPVATSAAPMAFERKLAHMALHARLEKEMPTQVPIRADEENFSPAQTFMYSNVPFAMAFPDVNRVRSQRESSHIHRTCFAARA